MDSQGEKINIEIDFEKSRWEAPKLILLDKKDTNSSGFTSGTAENSTYTNPAAS